MQDDIVKQNPATQPSNQASMVNMNVEKPATQLAIAQNPMGLSMDSVKTSGKPVEIIGSDDEIIPGAKTKSRSKGKENKDQTQLRSSSAPILAISLAVIVCLLLIGLVVYVKLKP